MLTRDLFQRPAVPIEVKPSPPKFDLAANNFPPLPGCVVSTQGEPVLENRMSDVVRGLNRDKVRRSGVSSVSLRVLIKHVVDLNGRS